MICTSGMSSSTSIIGGVAEAAGATDIATGALIILV